MIGATGTTGGGRTGLVVELPAATLLPELDAALYRAAARIPGVSVVADAEDAPAAPASA
ncbi:hypothetical protein [Streptomyces sp. NPDC001123]